MGLLSKLFRRSSDLDEMPGTDLLREKGSSPLLRVSRQLMTAGRNDRALSLLRAGLLRFPDDAEVAELHATAEREEAMPQIDAARQTLTEEASAKNHARMSQLARRVGDSETAMEQGRSSIAVDPQSPFGYRAIGRIYLDRFRQTSSTVDGMNALRYFSKACALDPRHAASLLALAEVFVLLRAPEAARRFLAPVAHSHPTDPTVEILERRCSALPAEGTSNVQELFLRHESGEVESTPSKTVSADVSSQVEELVSEMVEGIEGTRSVWAFDANRQLVAQTGEGDHSEDDVAGLGILAATIRSCSSRMGVGDFERILLRGDDQLVVVNSFGDGMTGFYFGDRPSRQSDVEQAFERIGQACPETAKGAAQ